MEAVGDEFSGAGMLEPSGSEQDDAAQQREKVAVADGVALNVRDAKPVHVSFLLDGGQASNGLSTSSDVPSVPYSTTKVTSGTISKEALGSNQQAGGTCQVSLQNEDEKGIADLSTLVEEEKTDHACVDTEAMVELQQSRSLPDAIALLSKTTDDLEGRVNVLLAQHEEEFFAAFRSHMAKVQKHIENLQACADEQKNLLERDLRIKTLQQELQWFVSEAVRLDQNTGVNGISKESQSALPDQVCKKLKGDLLSWRARTDALREDRDFLEAELKKAKRKLRSSQLQDPSKFCTTLQVKSNGFCTARYFTPVYC
ncbi:myosin heavy chain, putative [Eimeria praecox]|uniref:Myosin heavy chain, putative n=1 Tax=Eimeria praecox TaxID=51316 RepID=U6G5X1_9EIME|nr:myosin heavy chain, putative [Eimeria praecox]